MCAIATCGGSKPPTSSGLILCYNKAMLWQDVEGTIPADKNGDPVGRVDLMSGHFSAALFEPTYTLTPGLKIEFYFSDNINLNPPKDRDNP